MDFPEGLSTGGVRRVGGGRWERMEWEWREKQKKKNVYRLAKTNKNPTARLC